MDATQTTCPACGAPVLEDRLTCQECGTVIAAVTGAVHPHPPPAATPGLFDESALPPPTAPPVHEAAPIAPPHPTTRPELGPNSWYSTRAASETLPSGAAPAAPPAAGRAGLLSDLPLQVPATLGGRMAVLGLALAAIAFVLPWTPPTGFSWFDAWGLARFSTIVAFVATLVLFVLAIEPVPIAARVRTGWLPALWGAFAGGLFWSHVDGLASVGLGVWLFLLGGALALVGGLLVLGRREPAPPAA